MKGPTTMLFKSPMGRQSEKKITTVRYETTPGSGSDAGESEMSHNNLRSH